MIKNLLVSFLAFAFITVQANAVTNNNLKAAFDDLSYSLNVEWDQKDRAFYEAQMKKFTDKVAELQAAGMTNAELMDFASANIKDANLKTEVKNVMALVQINKLSASEARKMINDTIAKNYNMGASWSGDGVLYGALIVLILVAVIAGAAAGGGSSSNGGSSSCFDEYVCYDYYDSWGYYWYSDCGYERVCY